MPDLVEISNRFIKAVENNNEGERTEMLKWIFGNQDHEGQYHHWGWHFKYLKKFLEEIGFKNIKQKEPQNDTRPKELSFRLEAEK